MNALIIAIYVITGLYMILNFKYDIQMFQQNSYRISRYWKWLRYNYATTSRIIDLALIFILISTLLHPLASALITAVVCIVKSVLAFRKKYKKPLVFTARVKRLYTTTGLLAVAAYLPAIICITPSSIYWGSYYGMSLSLSVALLIAAISWCFVILADTILMPVEKAICSHYINDAKRILASMPDMKVIGITGSYGKTSTKHYLHRILSEKYDVLMTPGSFNTPMGVVRTVREYLKPYNEIFICEMGAKQIGDIKEICDIVHPTIGVITSVGPMHLESFKTIENVQKTKFELADSLPSDGLAVVNNDFEYCANRDINNCRSARYAVTDPKGAIFRATNVKYTPDGTSFTVEGPENFSMNVHTRLLGECNVSDLLAAICVALYLDVEPSTIKYAIESIEQVEHRLSMKKTPGGVTIIDDAFNSNPSGSKMAVDVLSQFTGGKRIIVTPGMIELGERQYELNKVLGENIGKNVDVAIIVGEYNRKALSEGITDTEFKEDNLYIVNSFIEAQQVLSKILRSGDTVLYENDLPDTFK